MDEILQQKVVRIDKWCINALHKVMKLLRFLFMSNITRIHLCSDKNAKFSYIPYYNTIMKLVHGKNAI